jgi:hypothetical protein
MFPVPHHAFVSFLDRVKIRIECALSRIGGSFDFTRVEPGPFAREACIDPDSEELGFRQIHRIVAIVSSDQYVGKMSSNQLAPGAGFPPGGRQWYIIYETLREICT